MLDLQRLNARTKTMIIGLMTDSPYKSDYMKEFFKEAEKHPAGNVVISYFSGLRSVKKSRVINSENSANMKNFTDIFINAVNRDAEFKSSFGKIVKNLGEYNSTLRKRFFLAEKGFINCELVKKYGICERIKREFSKCFYQFYQNKQCNKLINGINY